MAFDAEELFSKRAKNEISDFDAAIEIQKCARQLGKTLAEYLATDEGHNANQNLARARYWEHQLQHSNGDARAAFLKSERPRRWQRCRNRPIWAASSHSA